MRSRNQVVGWIGMLGLAVGLTVGLAACEPPEEPAAEAPSTAVPMGAPTEAMVAAAPEPVTITATDFAYEAPATIPGGMTEFEFVNAGELSHSLVITQLPADKTMDDLIEVLTAEEAAIPEWLSFPGGIGGIEPGTSATATINMAPGSYVIFSFEQDSADNVPDFAKGMMQALEVTDVAAAQAAAPEADVTVDLEEFAFISSGPFQSGQQVVHVKNTGQQLHEMLVMRLADGVTAEQVVEMITSFPGEAEAAPDDDTAAAGTPTEGAMAESTPEDGAPAEEAPEAPPFTSVGGLTPINAGADGFVSLNLTAGNYVILCFVPDPADGAPHMAKGMALPFTVQ